MSNYQSDYDIDKSNRSKNIVKIEKRLTYLAEHDVRNEEMYVLLKKLAYIFINQNKFVYGYNGVDEVCHDIASDVWMSVINGKRIYAWIYYIGRMIKLTYVPNQKKLEHEVIAVDDNPELREAIKRMCASSAIASINDFDVMERMLALDNISHLIKQTLEHTKFKEGSREYSQVYLNVCFNLVREIYGEKEDYIRIDKHLIPYVNIIIKQFKENFKKSEFLGSIMDGVEADLEMWLLNINQDNRSEGC